MNSGHLLLSGLFVILVQSVSAQFNIKIGYQTGFPQFHAFDDILASYSPSGFEEIDAFSPLGFIHGIQLGARYNLGQSSIELGWDNMSRDRSSLIYSSASDSFSDRVYNLSLSSFVVGADRYFGNVGIGSALLFSSMHISREIGNNRLSLVKETQSQLQLRLSWKVQESRTIALYLRPYYQFSLGDYNLLPLALDVNANNPAANTSEHGRIIGVSFVFYNGRQR